MQETGTFESILEEAEKARKLKERILEAKKNLESPDTPAYVKRELEHYKSAADEIIRKYESVQKEIDDFMMLGGALKKDWSEFESAIFGTGKEAAEKIPAGPEEKKEEPKTVISKHGKIEIFPAIYAHLVNHPDDVLGTKEVLKILESSGRKINERYLRRKLQSPDKEWTDKIDFGYEDSKGFVKKHRITLKKEDEFYAMLDGFFVSKKELKSLEEYLPHGHAKEAYELIFITKSPEKTENIGRLGLAVVGYLKKKGIDAEINKGVLYAK